MRGANRETNVRNGSEPAAGSSPSAAATVSATRRGSATGTRSTNHTPSWYESRSRRAASSASRVLPAPPTPVSVRSRPPPIRRWISAISRSRPTKLVNVGREVVPGGLGRPGLLHVEAAGQEVAVEPSRPGIGIGAVRRPQIAAEPLVASQRLRPPARRRVQSHEAANRALVERVARERALQRVERLRLLPGRARRVREVDKEVAEALAQFLTRPGGPVLEPVLREKIAGVRGCRGAQAGEVAVGPGRSRQSFEAAHVDLDEPVRIQCHDVVPQLQQAVARPVTRKRPTGDVQHLVQVVHRGHRIAVRP